MFGGHDGLDGINDDGVDGVDGVPVTSVRGPPPEAFIRSGINRRRM